MPNPNAAPTDSPRPKKGAELELTVDRLAYGGRGVARHNGYVVFVPHTAPGDVVRAVLTERKSSFGEARVLEILRPAPERIEPRCNLAGTCGGCSWQHLPIEIQREAKGAIVQESLRTIPGVADTIFEPVVPSPDTWRYRNKVEFTFARDRDSNQLVGGFHRPSDWRRILDVEQCHLAPEGMERILRAAITEGERQQLTAWDPRAHRGTLRQLVLRHSVAEDALIVLLLTGGREGLDFPAFCRALRAAEPTVRSITWGMNSNVSDVARAEAILGNDGPEFLQERLRNLTFRVSLASFFQSNSRGAEKLYDAALEMAELSGAETLLDAYCGTGTIAQYCAPYCKTVVGLELIREAVWDARENALHNGLGNCTFIAGDIRQTLPLAESSIAGSFDRVIMDPPRGGMEKKALQQLLDLRAPLMVYVSCNPTTMARDLIQAHEAGYSLERVRPVDLFPQTYHIECVAALRRRPQP